MRRVLTFLAELVSFSLFLAVILFCVVILHAL